MLKWVFMRCAKKMDVQICNDHKARVCEIPVVKCISQSVSWKFIYKLTYLLIQFIVWFNGQWSMETLVYLYGSEFAVQTLLVLRYLSAIKELWLFYELIYWFAMSHWKAVSAMFKESVPFLVPSAPGTKTAPLVDFMKWNMHVRKIWWTGQPIQSIMSHRNF